MGIQQYTGKTTLVVFTWNKFIVFTDNQNMWKGLPEKVKNYQIPFLDNHYKVGEELLNIIRFDDHMVEIKRNMPENISCSYDVDGNGQLSFTFPLKEEHLRFRPDDKEEVRLNAHHVMPSFFEYLINNSAYLKYLRQSEGELFGSEYIRQIPEIGSMAGEYYHKLAPEYMFQPMQPVWLFNLAKDGYWYKNFTGFIQKTQENDTPGRERTLTVSAINTLGLFQKVPILHKMYGSVFLEKLMNTEESREQEPILRTWLGSYFAPKGQSMDTIAEYKLEELLPRLMKSVNRCYGLIDTGPDIKVEASELSKSLQSTKLFTSAGVDEAAAEQFLRAVEEFRPYRFRIIKESSDTLETYSGESLRMEDEEGKSGILTINDLVDTEGNISNLYKGVNFIVDTQKLNSFNKMFSQTAQLWQLNYSSVAEILRKITTVFIVDMWTNGNGDIVMDYPRFNDIPSYDEQTDGNLELHYEDHTNKYIIEKRDSSFSFMEDGGKLITMMVAPIAYNYGIDMNVAGRTLLTGYSWGDFKQMMNFGLIRKDLSRLFAVQGLSEKSSKSIREFGDSVARAFRERYNADVFSGSFESPGRFDLQVGRNVLIPHKERTYFIKSIRMSINPGKRYSTSFNISYGKPLWKGLENPWLKDLFIECIIPGDREKPINYSCYLTEENLCEILQECIKNLLMNLCKKTEEVAQDWIDGEFSGNLCDSVLQVFYMIKQNYPKDSKGFEIDARLMYMLSKIQRFFTDNKDEIFLPEDVPKSGKFDWFPWLDIELEDSEYFHDERRKGGKMALIKGIYIIEIGYGGTASQTVTGQDPLLVCKKLPHYIDLQYRTLAEAVVQQEIDRVKKPWIPAIFHYAKDPTPPGGRDGNIYADYIFTASAGAILKFQDLDCKFLEWQQLKDENIRISKLDNKEIISTGTTIRNIINDIKFDHAVKDEILSSTGAEATCEALEEIPTLRDSKYTNYKDVAGIDTGEISILEFVPHISYIIYHCNVEHYTPSEDKSKLQIATIPIYKAGMLVTAGTYFEAIAEDTNEILKELELISCDRCMPNDETYNKWKDLVKKASKKHGVDQELIFAVIQWESGGKTISGRNIGFYDESLGLKNKWDISAGLMHVTANLLYGKKGPPIVQQPAPQYPIRVYYFPDWLYVPENCIDIGTQCLKELKEKYGNSYYEIYRHYNGGKNPGQFSNSGGTCVKKCATKWKKQYNL